MSDLAIRVTNLGKRYRIGAAGPRYKTLRDSLTGAFHSLGRRPTAEDSTIWALKDVSFDVHQGEVIGVIGRNGAGKSTLLKILAHITRPTTGRVEIHGRVGSLLEVGTGFHPELTGRDNIYLNGAILGMTRREIDRKFDEIVDFAEIEKFIDTPAKHYSSGMYMRLAFAVAAHLEPEILLVDEVLAVGDAAFQKKCLGKMGEVAKGGRTIFLVSHSMVAISNLCNKSIYLSYGSIKNQGKTSLVIKDYERQLTGSYETDLSLRKDREGNGKVICTGLKIINQDGAIGSILETGSSFAFIFEYDAKTTMKDIYLGIGIDTTEGSRLLTLFSQFTGQSFTIAKGKGKFICKVSSLDLRPDIYQVTTFIGNPIEPIDHLRNAMTLEFCEKDYYGSGRLPSKEQGPMLVKHFWYPESTLSGVDDKK